MAFLRHQFARIGTSRAPVQRNSCVIHRPDVKRISDLECGGGVRNVLATLCNDLRYGATGRIDFPDTPSGTATSATKTANDRQITGESCSRRENLSAGGHGKVVRRATNSHAPKLLTRRDRRDDDLRIAGVRVIERSVVLRNGDAVRYCRLRSRNVRPTLLARTQHDVS